MVGGCRAVRSDNLLPLVGVGAEKSFKAEEDVDGEQLFGELMGECGGFGSPFQEQLRDALSVSSTRR